MKYRSKRKDQKAKVQVKSFQKEVIDHWKINGRHTLPWRKTKDPYRVLVSEMMLQQTQVERVLPYYRKFLQKYPTVQKLAKAELSAVLKLWSGLGYNRRAKYLQDAAKAVVTKHKGIYPKSYDELRKFPGVGDYTARAVRVFAFNEPDILVETNIRTVFFHHYYSSILQNTAINDKELLVRASEAAEGQDPRGWHWALMDYGSFLKRSGVRLNQKSSQYSKQTKFEGSSRQLRGEVLRRILNRGKGLKGKKWNVVLKALQKEGLVVQVKSKWQIS